MTIEPALRLIAGIFVLLSLAPSVFHSQNWLLLTAFVGLNLQKKLAPGQKPGMQSSENRPAPSCTMPSLSAWVYFPCWQPP